MGTLGPAIVKGHHWN